MATSWWPHGLQHDRLPCPSPGSQSSHKLMSIELVMLSNHLILCHLFLFLLPILPRIRVFSNESVLHIKWPKCWSFSFSISLCNEYSGPISFKIDCFDLVVQGTFKSLLQHHSSETWILQCFLYGPTLTSIHDYWKYYSFD